MIEFLSETLKVVAIIFSIIFLLRLMYDFTIGNVINNKRKKELDIVREELIDKLKEELKK